MSETTNIEQSAEQPAFAAPTFTLSADKPGNTRALMALLGMLAEHDLTPSNRSGFLGGEQRQEKFELYLDEQKRAGCPIRP